MDRNGMSQDRLQLGFPEATTFRSLLVCDVARCLVVGASLAGERGHQLRLYVRGFDEPRYREIPWPAGCNSFGSPVASPRAPFLFAIGEHCTRTGGSGLGLYRVDLHNLALERVESAVKHFQGPDPRRVAGDPWIAQLLGFAGDGERLLATVATTTTSGQQLHYTYSVCTLDPSNGALEKQTDLPAIFA
jgi:hypothetical protein